MMWAYVATDPAYAELVAWTLTLTVCWLALLVTRYLGRS